MITKVFLSKVNTIIKDSVINTGINPIAELLYGKNTSRMLIYFDHNKIKKYIDDGIMPDINKMKHRLKITNAGSLDFTMLHHCETSSIDDSVKRRASSFDLIFFLIPKTWDSGKGFDYTKNVLNMDYYDTSQKDRNRLVSTDGCNWFQRRNGIEWDEEGVYSNETLSNEYDNFSSNKGSKIVFARQRFDVGNESIDVDITDIVNKFISGEIENNGIGIAFTPALERLGEDKTKPVANVENYIGFFTNKTNTFFEPFVETRYYDYIDDDRANFVIDKDNKLYLYCNIGSNLTDLDYNPTVTIRNSYDEVVSDKNGVLLENIESKHFSRGIYYVDVNISHNDAEPDIMFYDTWDNIIYNGTKIEPVELDFTLKNPTMYFNISNKVEVNERLSPTISGINNSEKIKRGDIRKIRIDARVNYSQQDYQLINGMETRLYVMDGTRELDVLSWEPVNKTYLENYIIIDTNILLPQRYYLDVKIKYGMEEIIHHDTLHFDIVDDINNRYA